MSKQGTIRVLVVDDHRVVRAGVVAILSDHPELEVVGEAEGLSDVMAQVEKSQPDLALVDLRLADGSGLEVCQRLKTFNPCLRVVILTSYVEPNLVFDALEAKADGYLLKDSHQDALVASLVAVARGEQVLSPAVTRVLMEAQSSSRSPRSGIDHLSNRELSMLKLVVDGLTYKEIAAQLGLAEKTVRNTFSLMMSKVGVHTRAQLVAEFIRRPGVQT